MLTTWDAVSTLNRMFDDMTGAAEAATQPRSFHPEIDVRTTEEQIIVECDVPGFKEEDLSITLDKHVLTIKGKRDFAGRKNGERLVLGRSYGSFTRTFTLPEVADESKLVAHLEAGVLTVTIPKQPKAKPQKISIAITPRA
jgi:HSP20 family protein